MKRRILTVLLCLLLLSGTVVRAAGVSRLVDQAGLLTSAEAQKVEAALDDYSQRLQVDLVVITVDSLDGRQPRDFADDYFDEHGYGENHDGILLMLAMDSRDWWISTCGFGITALTDAGLEYLSAQFLPSLKSGDYAEAFLTFATLCADFVERAQAGEPVDVGNLPKDPPSLLWIPGALGIGALVALVTVGAMAGKNRSVRSQAAANSYVVPGSMQLRENRDLFLYAHTSRTARPRDTGGGGSRTHTSSSGRSHGGGGGKF